MRKSDEVRWFYNQHLPGEVRSWFCGSLLCKLERARTDRYLVLAGSKDVGVKLRDDQQLEIKARTKMPEPLTLVTGASVGLLDGWVKWSYADAEVAGRLSALAAGSSEWVAVTKSRWIRKFRLDAAGDVQEIDAATQLEHGCQVELGEVTVRESHWWTLAFESFGEGNRPTNLEQVARHFLKVLPHGLALTERDSMAYPEWLNNLAG